MSDPMARLYPEHVVGGYSRVDGAVDFYTRVDALLRPDMTVLDYGAGRGAYLDEQPSYRQRLMRLQGRVARVVGADVDPAVRDNPGLDEAVVLTPGQPVPLPDRSIDLVVSDHTFEHVEDPQQTAAEMARLVRPGGWVCARTPNRYGYIATGARLVPERLHQRVLSRAQPEREERDVFPAHYLMNTRRQVRALFPEPDWTLHAYTVNAEPAYFGQVTTAWRAVNLVHRFLPQSLGATWLFFLQRTGADPVAA